jgi:hypothetical protein
MEKWIIIIFIVLLVLVTVLLLAAFILLRKGFRFIKRLFSGEMTDEEFERLSKKNYRGANGPAFDKDYFKGTRKQQQSRQQQTGHHRTTQTDDGVTIIDRRDPDKANKKIFAQDEGEYVEFKEIEN